MTHCQEPLATGAQRHLGDAARLRAAPGVAGGVITAPGSHGNLCCSAGYSAGTSRLYPEGGAGADPFAMNSWIPVGEG